MFQLTLDEQNRPIETTELGKVHNRFLCIDTTAGGHQAADRPEFCIGRLIVKVRSFRLKIIMYLHFGFEMQKY